MKHLHIMLLLSVCLARGTAETSDQVSATAVIQSGKSPTPSAAATSSPAVVAPPRAGQVPVSGETSEIVRSIQIEGAVNVKPADISARLTTRIGAMLTKDTLREDLKDIWDMGRFEDVSVDVTPMAGGYRVTFVLIERPVIHAVKYVGFKELGEKELQEKVPVKEGDYYDPVVVKETADRLLSAYREKGYPEIVVKDELAPAEKDRTRMDLVLTAVEGPKVKVNKISFEGNKLFPASALRKVLKNKEAAFFFQSGLFLKDELDRDRQRLVDFYKNEGYQKVRIQPAEVSPLPEKDKNRVDIKFTVSEGMMYSVRSVTFEGATLFPQKELEGKLNLQPGAKMSQRVLDEGVATLRELYTKRGYIYANVVPDISYDDAKGTADTVLRFYEGAIAYIDRIVIRGNEETKDRVIMREVHDLIKPGDKFDTIKIRKSQERVYNLGFFEDVKVYTESSMKAGRENLVFDVKERQTGTISLGGGYSSQYGFLGFLQLTKANLFGLGIRISAEWEIGQKRKNISLDYFDPYLLDMPVSLGLGFWDTNRDLTNSYSQRSTGGSVELGHRFQENWRVVLGYRYQIDEISQLGGVPLPDDVARHPRSRTSSPTLTLTYDTRDNIFDPMNGWYHRWFAQVAGGPYPRADMKFLGGDTEYYKVMYDASYFQPSPTRLLPYIPKPSLALHARMGRGWGYNHQSLPLFERFYLGGTDSIRGYDERSLGPRGDAASYYTPTGGTAMLQFNAELKWPLISRVLTIAAPFYDIGNAWDHFPLTMDYLRRISGSGEQGIPNTYLLAQSAGIGIRLTIPGTIIVIRLDYGWGLVDIYEDPYRNIKPGHGQLHFNIGNIF